jgi:hypothetical protein
MRTVRKYGSLVLFVLFLVVCSVLVIRQFVANESRHVDLREAFILLQSKGYQREAAQLYQRLLNEVGDLSNALMWNDYQRTLTLIDPASDETNNLIWQYHWTISNELEKRSESNLEKALKMAREK